MNSRQPGTATPDRSDQRSLGEIFQEIAFEIGLPELIEQRYLAPICVETLPLKSIHNACEDVDHASVPEAKATLSQKAVISRQFKVRQV